MYTDNNIVGVVRVFNDTAGSVVDYSPNVTELQRQLVLLVQWFKSSSNKCNDIMPIKLCMEFLLLERNLQ